MFWQVFSLFGLMFLFIIIIIIFLFAINKPVTHHPTSPANHYHRDPPKKPPQAT
jgi:hypothetical protein